MLPVLNFVAFRFRVGVLSRGLKFSQCPHQSCRVASFGLCSTFFVAFRTEVGVCCSVLKFHEIIAYLTPSRTILCKNHAFSDSRSSGLKFGFPERNIPGVAKQTMRFEYTMSS